MGESRKLCATRATGSSSIEITEFWEPVWVRAPSGPFASSYMEKVDLLRAQLFPAPNPADLADISPNSSGNGESSRWEVAQEEIVRVIQSLPNKKAPGVSGVPNSFLKAMGPRLVAALTLVTQACLDWEYYPQAFKTARTVALRKSGKGDYQAPKSWRPIALLDSGEGD